jgi:hypothetical protein
VGSRAQSLNFYKTCSRLDILIIFLQYNVAILFFLGLNFQKKFLNFYANCPRPTDTVKGCKKVVCFIQANYQSFYLNVKNA